MKIGDKVTAPVEGTIVAIYGSVAIIELADGTTRARLLSALS
jgi:hypothetical protein